MIIRPQRSKIKFTMSDFAALACQSSISSSPQPLSLRLLHNLYYLYFNIRNFISPLSVTCGTATYISTKGMSSCVCSATCVYMSAPLVKSATKLKASSGHCPSSPGTRNYITNHYIIIIKNTVIFTNAFLQ